MRVIYRYVSDSNGSKETSPSMCQTKVTITNPLAPSAVLPVTSLGTVAVMALFRTGLLFLHIKKFPETTKKF